MYTPKLLLMIFQNSYIDADPPVSGMQMQLKQKHKIFCTNDFSHEKKYLKKIFLKIWLIEPEKNKPTQKVKDIFLCLINKKGVFMYGR